MVCDPLAAGGVADGVLFAGGGVTGAELFSAVRQPANIERTLIASAEPILEILFMKALPWMVAQKHLAPASQTPSEVGDYGLKHASCHGLFCAAGAPVKSLYSYAFDK